MMYITNSVWEELKAEARNRRERAEEERLRRLEDANRYRGLGDEVLDIMESEEY